MCVVADGPIARVPLEALVVADAENRDATAQDLKFWIDEGPAVSYVPLLSVLLDRKRVRDAQLAEVDSVQGDRPLLVALGGEIFEKVGERRILTTRSRMFHRRRTCRWSGRTRRVADG